MYSNRTYSTSSKTTNYDRMKIQTLHKKHIISISLIIVLLDQISKTIVRSSFSEGASIIFISKIINFHFTTNSGAAFSLFNNSGTQLAILSLTVSLILFIWIWRSRPFQLWRALGIGFLLGGTIGNGLDRWRFGYVIDFIEIIPFKFPIFNLADVSINFAVFFLILDSFINNKSTKN